jgi:hypothetical protein
MLWIVLDLGSGRLMGRWTFSESAVSDCNVAKNKMAAESIDKPRTNRLFQAY